MRLSWIVLASLAACAVAASGCSVDSNSGNSASITPPKKYVAPPVAKTATWDGTSLIDIETADGDVTVSPSSDATSITIAVTPFAYASGDAQADGDAAVTDVQGTIFVSSAASGPVTIKCGQAAAPHGSAPVATTGCDLVVTVPAGSVTLPMNLSASSAEGDVDVSGLTGAALAKSTGDGDVSLSVTPTKGAVIAATASSGNVTLTLPSDFAADAITLRAGANGNVASDFTDVTKTTPSRGTPGTGASSITATTDAGNVTLKSM